MEKEQNEAFGRQVVRKISIKILPCVLVLYIFSYINRTNIGYAALQMNQDLGLGSDVFGLAAGVFFIGYFLFEVPKNILFPIYGSRCCLTWILATWGLASLGTAFVQTPHQLYAVRFILGVTEAGFFPGVLYYLAGWFPVRDRATSVALFAVGIPVSYLIGAPVSTWLMVHVGGFGLAGWRWMFLIEALPAILGAPYVYFVMVDHPRQANWLDREESAWLEAQIPAEKKSETRIGALFLAMVNPKILLLAAIYFVYQAGSLAIGYWMPLIVKSFSASLSVTLIGVVVALPYAVASVAMIWWSSRSDRKAERKWHAALPLLLAAGALACTGLTTQPVLSMGLITLALCGFYAFKAPFWALPGLFLSRTGAAVSIAAINSIGNLGGFVGPYLVGAVKQATGSSMLGLLMLSALVMVSFVMTVALRLKAPQPA